jgi:hypothetical protein
MTYIAEEITEEIRLAGPCLSSVHRSMIHKEIRKALDTDRAGMQVDRDEWARILELPVEDE